MAGALAYEMGKANFNADHVSAVIQRGEHTGFIRRDPLTDEFHPGIPSLLTHIAKAGAKSPRKHRNSHSKQTQWNRSQECNHERCRCQASEKAHPSI